MNFVHAAHINQAVREAKKQPDAILLDAGCSDGEFFFRMDEQYRFAVGLDHNPEALQTLKERLPQESVQVMQGDICNLSFSDDTFDVVCCLETLEHVYDMPKAVQELHRVLKKGGKIIITVPIERGFSVLLKQGVAKLFFGGYRGSYTWRELFYAFTGQLDKIERVSLSSHKGFDYQNVHDEILKYFENIHTSGLPFKPFSTFLNTQFFISAEKR